MFLFFSLSLSEKFAQQISVLVSNRVAASLGVTRTISGRNSGRRRRQTKSRRWFVPAAPPGDGFVNFREKRRGVLRIDLNAAYFTTFFFFVLITYLCRTKTELYIVLGLLSNYDHVIILETGLYYYELYLAT